jgi:hypothetical protein
LPDGALKIVATGAKEDGAQEEAAHADLSARLL